MTQTFESWYSSIITETLLSWDTTVNVLIAPTVTSWRLFITDWYRKERLSFSWVSWNQLTWLIRWLSQTSDPATSWTWYIWYPWATIKLVAMHDQLLDKNQWLELVWFTTTERDNLVIPTWKSIIIYNTTTWTNQQYIWWVWIDIWTSTTPFASSTVAWKVEIGTQSEITNWTSTWWTWASLVATPDILASTIQSNSYIYAHSITWTDTYTATLTPAITAYTTWMKVTIKFDTVNTWACSLNLNWLWAKNIKTVWWNDPQDWDIIAWWIVDLIYDWTNFILMKISQKATDAESLLWVEDTKYITSKQLYTNSWFSKIIRISQVWKLTNYDTWIPFWTYWKISINFTALEYTRGDPSEVTCSTWTLFFDNASWKWSVVVAWKNVTTWATPRQSWLSAWVGSNSSRTQERYDNAYSNTMTLDKWATNYRLNYDATFWLTALNIIYMFVINYSL